MKICSRLIGAAVVGLILTQPALALDENLNGVVTVDGDLAKLTRPGDDRPDYQGDWWARQARSHAAEANKFFRQRPGARPWVTAVVVLWADFPQGSAQGKNMSFVSGEQLVTWLTEQPIRLDSAKIDRLKAALEPRHRRIAATSSTPA